MSERSYARCRCGVKSFTRSFRSSSRLPACDSFYGILSLFFLDELPEPVHTGAISQSEKTHFCLTLAHCTSSDSSSKKNRPIASRGCTLVLSNVVTERNYARLLSSTFVYRSVILGHFPRGSSTVGAVSLCRFVYRSVSTIIELVRITETVNSGMIQRYRSASFRDAYFSDRLETSARTSRLFQDANAPYFVALFNRGGGRDARTRINVGVLPSPLGLPSLTILSPLQAGHDPAFDTVYFHERP